MCPAQSPPALPVELELHILRLLPTKDLLRGAACACKHWRDVVYANATSSDSLEIIVDVRHRAWSTERAAAESAIVARGGLAASYVVVLFLPKKRRVSSKVRHAETALCVQRWMERAVSCWVSSGDHDGLAPFFPVCLPRLQELHVKGSSDDVMYITDSDAASSTTNALASEDSDPSIYSALCNVLLLNRTDAPALRSLWVDRSARLCPSVRWSALRSVACSVYDLDELRAILRASPSLLTAIIDVHRLHHPDEEEPLAPAYARPNADLVLRTEMHALGHALQLAVLVRARSVVVELSSTLETRVEEDSFWNFVCAYWPAVRRLEPYLGDSDRSAGCWVSPLDDSHVVFVRAARKQSDSSLAAMRQAPDGLRQELLRIEDRARELVPKDWGHQTKAYW